MNAATKNAPGERSDAHTGARTPSLDRKAGTVDPIMHDRLARRSQRHAAQRRPVEAERRIATLEALLHITQEQMVADSLLLGTDSTHLPEPGEITAQTRRSDEAACAALAERIWTPAERLALGTLTAAPENTQDSPKDPS